MTSAVVGAIVGSLCLAVGWLARYVFTGLAGQVKDNKADLRILNNRVRALEVWQRDHVWTHRHRVVETGSTIDVADDEERDGSVQED